MRELMSIITTKAMTMTTKWMMMTRSRGCGGEPVGAKPYGRRKLRLYKITRAYVKKEYMYKEYVYKQTNVHINAHV